MAKKKRSRLPPVATGSLRAVAAVLEHPRFHGLLERPLRLARRRLPSGAESKFPATPPLPSGTSGCVGTTAPGERSDDGEAAALLRSTAGTSPREVSAAGGGPSVADFAAAYASGRANPIEVADALLAAVQDSERGPEDAMRFFIALDVDDVRAQAAASAVRHREGRPVSLLDGVPVAVKDEIDQRGYVTTLGTRMPDMLRATRDCAAVGRLRAQGALLVGKTNMHELGAGPTGWNAAWGTTRNPWDPRHFPGGSSSGSAAAVAAGLVPLAVGCDGGGSIRVPASFCGVVGLKPTFGRIPKAGETPPIAHSITHIGPLGQTVRDVAMGYAAMAGPLSDDERTAVTADDSAPQPPPSLRGWDHTELGDLTLGVVEAWWADAELEVARACERTLGALQACGARVVDVSVEGLDDVRGVLIVTVAAELQHNAWFHNRAARRMLAPDTRIGLALARHLTRSEYHAAQRVRAHIGAAMWRLLTTVDVLVSPSTLLTAPPVPRDGRGLTDVAQTIRVMKTTAIANITGQPAISFPAGFDKGGLPVGFQVMGRPWEETTLLRVARAAERARERRTPRRFWQLL